MLDVIRDRAQSWVAKVILVLITIPFALWGVDSYLRGGADSAVVAEVDSQKISMQEFNQVLREQQERMRSVMKDAFDPAMLDKPEIRRSILDNLVEQRLLTGGAAEAGMVISDQMLAAFIAAIPDFQENGAFSQSRYESLLRNQGMTPVTFEARLRQGLMTEQFIDGLTHSTLVSRSALDAFIRLSEQQREMLQAMIVPEQFFPQIKVGNEQIKAYYDKHKETFRIPEQARLEYVVLSADDLAQQAVVSDEEIGKYFEEHAAQFQETEQRQASHILIAAAAAAAASEAEKNAARAKAEQLFKEASASPDKFAELASKHSQDPGSAAAGGDLGMFARGAMVKPFEDAVFGMKVGDVVGPVQSDFGFHIIKLAGIKPGRVRTLAESREEITQELKKQKAGKRFAEVAETFSNLVYEQPDSLKPVADALGLKIETSPWMGKKGGDVALLNNGKLLQAVFSDESIKLKRNSEAVEVRPNTLVAARVVEFKEASYKPLEGLSVELGARVQRDLANEQAAKRGAELLEQLRQGKDVADLKWGAPITVTRQSAASLGEAVVSEVFGADVGKLPFYTGAPDPKGGFLLIRVNRSIEPGALDDAKKKGYADRLRELLAQEYFAAYAASLKQRADIKIKTDLLEKVER
jgi:peptidyl-prolyl cis-trans isomerase D